MRRRCQNNRSDLAFLHCPLIGIMHAPATPCASTKNWLAGSVPPFRVSTEQRPPRPDIHLAASGPASCGIPFSTGDPVPTSRS